MTWLKSILVGILSCALCGAPAMATDNCANEMYRRYNPDRCSSAASKNSGMSFATTATVIGGAAAAVGGALALIGSASSDSNTSTTATNTPVYKNPTLTTTNMVGNDVASADLASIVNTTSYARNNDQYNDIRVAYSLARGYTGAGSTIAVFDAGADSDHGRNVAWFASGQIAPNVTIESYQIAEEYEYFYDFDTIGDIISSATNANIYNFSWSASNRYANSVHSRHQMESITDANFISSLTNAATEHDAIFVWAAGNDGHSQSSALSAMPLHIPELDGHFVNVVAWDSATGKLADYSNACGITMEYCITAPGSNLESPEAYWTLDGTSFAAPIVSAAIAVIREAFPYMKSTEITQLLFATARDLGAPGVDTIYGHGMLDLENATRPVGATLVPISDSTTVTLRTAHVSAPIGNQIKSQNIKFAFVDSFGRAFDTKMNDNIEIQNRSIAFERLRNNNLRSTQIGNIEFGFKHTDLFSGTGFLQTQSDNLLSFVGTSHHTTIGNTEIFHHTTFGATHPQTSPDSMISGFSNIYTASMTIGASRGDWTLTIGTPDTIIGGNMYLHAPTGRSNDGAYTYTTHTIDLATRPSIEYTASYKFLTAGFVDNPYGANEVYMIAKTKIQF